MPKVKAGEMISVRLSKNTKLEKSSWGILEPISNENECSYFDYVITPLLYCDKSGNRIGYGKGFYDEFFAKINLNAKKIGVNFFPPIESIEDVFENDVKLDYLIGVVDRPKIEMDVFIDRGVNSSFEQHMRLGDINSLTDLEKYGNGYFKIKEY